MENQLTLRRYEFDWLRVLAFSLLIFYHTGMFFVPWEWHLKNNEISEALLLPMRFLSQWRMSLIFLVSGVGVYFALGYRPAKPFVKDRFKRILLPLLIGMLVVVPPQVYFERVTQGYEGSYLQFFPSVFEGVPYPEGNFSWHHLWYLTYVLCYSLVLLPLLLYLRRSDLKVNLIKPWAIIVLPGLWSSLGAVLLNQRFPATNALVDDWANHFLYVSMFLLGFLLMKLPALQSQIRHVRYYSLVLAMGAFLLLVLPFQGKEYEEFTFTEQVLYQAVRSFNRWFWLLAILGLAMQHLNIKSKYLQQANEMVYPFYILHQTVIVALGFYLQNADLPIGPKFWLMVLGTFVICFLTIKYVIMPLNWLRVPFGLSPKKPAKVLTTSPEKHPAMDELPVQRAILEQGPR